MPHAQAGSVVYGPNVNAAAMLLASEANVPVERTALLMEALLNSPVSTGFVTRALARLAGRLHAAGFDAAMKDALRAIHPHFKVPWTNNASEQCPQRLQAASGRLGSWHTQATLADYCRIRSYLVSARGHGIRAIDAIHDALAGPTMATGARNRLTSRTHTRDYLRPAEPVLPQAPHSTGYLINGQSCFRAELVARYPILVANSKQRPYSFHHLADRRPPAPRSWLLRDDYAQLSGQAAQWLGLEGVRERIPRAPRQAPGFRAMLDQAEP